MNNYIIIGTIYCIPTLKYLLIWFSKNYNYFFKIINRTIIFIFKESILVSSPTINNGTHFLTVAQKDHKKNHCSC